ncbi:hypothetical protein ACFE04_005720 [Oxalis oulophora]
MAERWLLAADDDHVKGGPLRQRVIKTRAHGDAMAYKVRETGRLMVVVRVCDGDEERGRGGMVWWVMMVTGLMMNEGRERSIVLRGDGFGCEIGSGWVMGFRWRRREERGGGLRAMVVAGEGFGFGW